MTNLSSQTDTAGADSANRLREYPTERSQGDVQFDFADVVAKLRAEAHSGQDGHRQKTIFHRLPVTYVVFAFEAGGVFPNHSAPGLVTIQVLEGKLAVTSPEGETELSAGAMLVLQPNVPHSLRAPEQAAMLLTVHLEK